MALNARFATSVHVLALLAAAPDTLHRSEDLARRIGTNPVVVRRALSQLQRAGLILAHKGPSGGSKLARTPQEITLRDIFLATRPGLAPLPKSMPPGVRSSFKGAIGGAWRAFEDELALTTLAQLAKKAARKPRR